MLGAAARRPFIAQATSTSSLCASAGHEAAREIVLVAAVDAAVAAGEHDVTRARREAGTFEQRLQGRAGPFGGADRLVMPGLTLPARRDRGAGRCRRIPW